MCVCTYTGICLCTYVLYTYVTNSRHQLVLIIFFNLATRIFRSSEKYQPLCIWHLICILYLALVSIQSDDLYYDALGRMKLKHFKEAFSSTQ